MCNLISTVINLELLLQWNAVPSFRKMQYKSSYFLHLLFVKSLTLASQSIPDMVYIDNCICHQRISKAIVMLLKWKWYHFQYAKYQSPVILGPIKVVLPVFAKSHIISVTWCALSLGMTLFFCMPLCVVGYDQPFWNPLFFSFQLISKWAWYIHCNTWYAVFLDFSSWFSWYYSIFSIATCDIMKWFKANRNEHITILLFNFSYCLIYGCIS